MTEQQQQKTLLYTKNEIPEREIRETIAFSIASNRIKYQYSCLENPIGRGAWRATVHTVKKRDD